MDRLAQVREQQARNFAEGWPYRQQIAAMDMERQRLEWEAAIKIEQVRSKIVSEVSKQSISK